MFRARIMCGCGYDYLTAQTDPKMTLWAAEKIQKIHDKHCGKGSKIIYDREEDKPKA